MWLSGAGLFTGAELPHTCTWTVITMYAVDYCTHWRVNKKNNNSIYRAQVRHVELQMEPYPQLRWP